MSARISWLDVKLGVRMLIKHPALTLVGGFGIAVGVAISAGFFAFQLSLAYPTLPLEKGARIVALENRDLEANDEERRSLHDFFTWREELRAVEDLAAFRTVDRNLISGGEQPQPVHAAEITAAGFRVARVAPLLGRYLVEEDEHPGAPPVVVIGYDVWQNRFSGDRAVIGRQVRLDGTPHTVVGVMPESFAFPVNHRFWVPLRADPSAYERREGPAIFIFGRLARGVSMEDAQAELDAIGLRTAADFPETHARLRPMVMPYAHSLTGSQGISAWELAGAQFIASLLLLVVALNVAILVYARTAMRRGEIAVRSALGASRSRIVAQLFVEAFVLSAGAATLGLALAQVIYRQISRVQVASYDVGAPFWLDDGLQPATVLFTAGLAVLGAVIMGVIPALQATGRRLQPNLRLLGGAAGVGLGRTWTALIVAQVAIAVFVLPLVVDGVWDEIRSGATRPIYQPEEFLTAELTAEAGTAPASRAEATPFGSQVTELMRRLEDEPAVAGVTLRASLPGRGALVQVEDVAAPPETPSGHMVASQGIDPGFFDLFGVRVLAGRKFEPADLGEGARAVVVDRAFVQQVLGGASALGRRIRHVDPDRATEVGGTEPERWYEIVGVVENLQANPNPEQVRPGLLYPVAPRQVEAASVVVRLRGSTPADFAPRLRELAAAVDPSLRLGTVRSLAEANRRQQMIARHVALVLILVLTSIFLLSAAGVYALMSFTVTQRRREIGIRAALGAQPGQVLRSVFARAAGQIALGMVVGVASVALLHFATRGDLVGDRAMVLLSPVALTMAVVGALAALGPARRGLRIAPAEALRADA